MRVFAIALFLLTIGCQSGAPDGREPSALDATSFDSEADPSLPDTYGQLFVRTRTIDLWGTLQSQEDKICYDYAELLVANGHRRITDQNELVNQVYLHGRILLHHTATLLTPDQLIYTAIVDRGYSDVPYHFMITKRGEVVAGRPLSVMGASAGRIPNRDQDCANNRYYIKRDNDYRTIGIALIGNFEIESPTAAQVQQLGILISNLKQRFQIEEVIGHRDVKQTLCPGKNFHTPLKHFFTPLTFLGDSNRRRSTSPFIKENLVCYSCR